MGQPQAKLRAVVEAVFLILTTVLFVIPTLQVRFVYYLMIVVPLVPFVYECFSDRIIKIVSWYTIYLLCIGTFCVLATEDGTVSGVVYVPMKQWVLCFIVAAAFRNRSVSAFLGVMLTFTIVQLLAVCTEHYSGTPLWTRLPFAIHPEISTEYTQGNAKAFEFGITSSRFGGLTPEVSVLAGMTALFMCIAFSRLQLAVSNRQRGLLPVSDRVMCWTILFTGAGILSLAFTKSGVLILLAFAVVTVGEMFLSKKGRYYAVICAGCGMLLLVGMYVSYPYLVKIDSALEKYLEYETGRTVASFDKGASAWDDPEVNMRLVFWKLNMYGLISYPLGVGTDCGLTFMGPGLKEIQVTKTFDEMVGNGMVNGYACAILNNMKQAGLMSLLLLGWALRWPGKRMANSLGKHIWYALAASIVAFGLSIELAPFWGLIVFTWYYMSAADNS